MVTRNVATDKIRNLTGAKQGLHAWWLQPDGTQTHVSRVRYGHYPIRSAHVPTRSAPQLRRTT